MMTLASPRDHADTSALGWRCGLLVRHDGDSAVVYPTGELDVATAPRIHLALTELRGDGARHITVDLAGVTFLDTAGLRVLLEHDRLLRGRGGGLQVVRPSEQIERLLYITRTNHLLGPSLSLPDAKAERADPRSPQSAAA